MGAVLGVSARSPAALPESVVMSAEHRRPAAAFVVLALVAAAVVGIHRAEAQGGRLLAAVIGAGVSVHGTLPQAEPLPASVLGDAGPFAGGSFLVTSDAIEAEVEAAWPGDRPVVGAGAVARAAQRSDRTASGPIRRDEADRGRTAHKRDDGKRQVAAAVQKARSTECGAPARVVPAHAAAAPSHVASADSATSTRSRRPASAPSTGAQPRVGHHDRARRTADRALHAKAHPKTRRAAQRAASRKAFRR